MPFFEDLKKQVSNISQTVGEKTKASTESIRLNNMIREEQRRCKELYLQIGELYFQKYGSQSDLEFVKQVQEIQEAQKRIQSYQDQLQRAKAAASSSMSASDTVYCTSCGAALPANAKFCLSCGEKVFPLETPPVEVVSESPESAVPHVCANCGAELEEGALFCTNCGQKCS